MTDTPFTHGLLDDLRHILPDIETDWRYLIFVRLLCCLRLLYGSSVTLYDCYVGLLEYRHDAWMTRCMFRRSFATSPEAWRKRLCQCVFDHATTMIQSMYRCDAILQAQCWCRLECSMHVSEAMMIWLRFTLLLLSAFRPPIRPMLHFFNLSHLPKITPTLLDVGFNY